MYCRKCGSELRDDDEFCSRCGAKVLRETEPAPTSAEQPLQKTASTPPPAAAVPPAQSGISQRKRFTFRQSLLRFVICMAALAVCYTILYAVGPGKVSTMEFITSPHGLTWMMSGAFGSSLVAILFFLPLLYALPKRGYTERTYAMEVFFAWNLINGIFGEAMRALRPPIMILALIIGVLLYFLPDKKKSGKK